MERPSANQLVAINLARLRIARHLSQESLATLAAIDRSYVSGIERAKRNPSVAVLEGLARVLKADIREFFIPKG